MFCFTFFLISEAICCQERNFWRKKFFSKISKFCEL
ncbi:hypothetical protein T11_12420 [Trichinella zimbabwensis]|uniref:Uncharacterized protein n=1 Tax=Trichinella zimbabwensis TaxID=268475 RepID=A0A0V1F9W6_9BILA|nr:hypothetical protein T11_12420 [Trichinella zimbabwensis]